MSYLSTHKIGSGSAVALVTYGIMRFCNINSKISAAVGGCLGLLMYFGLAYQEGLRQPPPTSHKTKERRPIKRTKSSTVAFDRRPKELHQARPFTHYHYGSKALGDYTNTFTTDYGWGCAYRAIQGVLDALLRQWKKRYKTVQELNLDVDRRLLKRQCLGSVKKGYSVRYLYDMFCSKEKVQKILEKISIFSSKTIDSLISLFKPGLWSSKPWFEPQMGWAAVADLYGVKGRLAFYQPVKNTKPPSWLNTQLYSEPIVGVEELYNQLVKHFDEHGTPVMADDKTYANLIVGVKTGMDGRKYLLIKDTHVRNPHHATYELLMSHQQAKRFVKNDVKISTLTQDTFFSSGKTLMLWFPTLSNKYKNTYLKKN